MKTTRRNRRRKQTRRRRQRKGGKKLGEGASGIVIDPAIPCEGKDTSKYVSKVFFKKEYFDDAMANVSNVLAKLQEIDPNQEYFLYPEICETFGPLTDENRTDGVTDDNKGHSYLMRKAKHSLDIEYREKEAEIRKDVDKAIEYLTPIAKEALGLLKKLHDNNIIHNDFHPGNVVRMEDGTLRIIDFDGAYLLPVDTSRRGRLALKGDDVLNFVDTSASMIMGRYDPLDEQDKKVIATALLKL